MGGTRETRTGLVSEPATMSNIYQYGAYQNGLGGSNYYLIVTSNAGGITLNVADEGGTNHAFNFDQRCRTQLGKCAWPLSEHIRRSDNLPANERHFYGRSFGADTATSLYFRVRVYRVPSL